MKFLITKTKHNTKKLILNANRNRFPLAPLKFSKTEYSMRFPQGARTTCWA